MEQLGMEVVLTLRPGVFPQFLWPPNLWPDNAHYSRGAPSSECFVQLISTSLHEQNENLGSHHGPLE